MSSKEAKSVLALTPLGLKDGQENRPCGPSLAVQRPVGCCLRTFRVAKYLPPLRQYGQIGRPDRTLRSVGRRALIPTPGETRGVSVPEAAVQSKQNTHALISKPKIPERLMGPPSVSVDWRGRIAPRTLACELGCGPGRSGGGLCARGGQAHQAHLAHRGNAADQQYDRVRHL